MDGAWYFAGLFYVRPSSSRTFRALIGDGVLRNGAQTAKIQVEAGQALLLHHFFLQSNLWANLMTDQIVESKLFRSGRRGVRTGLALVAFLLFVSGATRLHAQLQNFVMPVVPAEETPTVDGTVKPAEWNQATSLIGLYHVEARVLENRGVRTYFIADRNHLYFAITSPLSKKGQEPGAHDFARDELREAFKDERIEINLAPPNYHQRGVFQMIVSYSGSTYDSKIDTATDKEDTSWNPEWTYEQSLRDGSWHFEGKIPVTELNYKKGEAPGTWGVNLGRAWSGSQMDLSGLNWRMSNRAEVQLVPGAPAFRIKELGDLPAGKVNLTFQARPYGTSSKKTNNNPKKLDVTCVIRTGGETLLRKNKELPVKKGEKGTVSIKKKIKSGKYKLFVLVEDPEGTVYYFNKATFSSDDN